MPLTVVKSHANVVTIGSDQEVKAVRNPLWLVYQATHMHASHGEGESMPFWASRTSFSANA